MLCGNSDENGNAIRDYDTAKRIRRRVTLQQKQFKKLEYVRNCVLVVIGKPNICCIQNLYNYSGDIYKYRVKWFSNSWGNWQTVS